MIYPLAHLCDVIYERSQSLLHVNNIFAKSDENKYFLLKMHTFLPTLRFLDFNGLLFPKVYN